MKRYAIILLFLFFALFLFGAEDMVRVVLDDNYPPYSFRDENGKLQGIIIDQWNEWDKITGIKVVLSGMNWQLALDEMNQGRADVIDTIFSIEERKHALLFTPPYADIEVSVFAHKTVSGITDLENLKGLRVAVKEGDASISILEKAGITDFIKYKNYAELVTHAKKKDFRVFCMDKPPALYLLNRAGIDTEYKVVTTLFTGHFTRAVAKGNEKLLARMQNGFEEIKPETYREIDRRWFGVTSNISFNYRPFILLSISIVSVLLFLLIFIQILRKRVAYKTKELQVHIQKLETSERRNSALIKALPDVIIIIDRSGVYTDCSASNPDLLLIPAENLIGRKISDFFSEEIIDKFMTAITLALDNGSIQQVEYSLDVPAGHRTFECRIVALDADHALYLSRDVTNRINHEEAMQKSLLEKDVLLREIHHRVKNNLQVISSIVALQAELFQNEEDKRLMQETQQRIHLMAQLHNMLYQSENFLSINIKEYISGIIDELVIVHHTLFSRIQLQKTIDEFSVSLDVAMPLGLIVNELVSNSFRYAFPGARTGTAEVYLSASDTTVTLLVKDDGIGLPEGFSMKDASSLGFVLVRALARQLGSTVTILPGPGTGFELVFESKTVFTHLSPVDN